MTGRVGAGGENRRRRGAAHGWRHDAERYRGSGHVGEPVDRRPGALARVPRGGRPDRVRERVAGALWLSAWRAARALPEAAAFVIADRAAVLAHGLARSTRARVASNQSRVVAPAALPATVRAAFRSYARYWVESFRAADLDPGDLDRRTTTSGFEHLDAVLERGRGAIVLLAHHGSWDVAARWAESHRYHLAVVAEVVRPHRLFVRFVELREAMGLEVVPLRPRHPGGAAAVTGRLEEVLAANHLVGLLADRDLTGRAPRVPFFGEPARLPAGPVALARRTGAPIVPITMLQQPGRCWHLAVHPAIDAANLDAREAHQVVAGALEELIRLDPAQWHAFQPVWTREGERGSATTTGSAEEGAA